VPILVRGWNAIKDGAKEAWDAMLGIGRDSTLDEQIKFLESARSHLRGPASVRDSVDDEIERLKKLKDELEKEAKAKADGKAATDAYIQSQQAASHAAEQFADAQQRINEAWQQFDVSAINRGLNTVIARYDAFSDELEEQRRANEVADAKYYARRRELIEKSAAAEIGALRKVNATLQNQDGMSAVERIAAQNKIADNEQRIGEIRIRTASQLRIVDTQEQKGLLDTANAYKDAQDAADRYTDTLIRRFRIESEGLGLGEKERQRLRDRAELESRFEDRRQSLDRDRRRGDITQKQYEEFLRIERAALDKSLGAYDDYYKRLEDKQGSWLVGVQEGLNNFADSAKDVAGQVADAIEGGMNRAVDAVVEFSRTGKINVGSLVDDILADLLRIELRVLASQVLKSFFGGSTGAATGNSSGSSAAAFVDAFRADGGPVDSGKPYVVGERGPELVVPRSPGWVIPNGGNMGAPSTINQTFYLAAGVTEEQLQAAVRVGKQQAVAETADNLRRGRWKWARR
jgi:lambda family phage tail tape measure protein